MKYNVKFSCGHTVEMQLYGSTRDRERKIEWYEKQVCPDCYKKQLAEERAKATVEAAEAAKTNNLPELTGSEKQVAWALTIRQNILSWLGNDRHQDKESKELYNKTIKMTDAKWWIDYRNSSWIDIKIFFKEHPEKVEENTIEAKSAKEEATIYPKEQTTQVSAELISVLGRIEIHSQKDAIIISTLKSHGCKWDNSCSRWYHNTGIVNGTAADRMAEIGNALLQAGVPVIIYDSEIRENAITGKFEPKHPRWILEGADGEIEIYWTYRDNDLYRHAKDLPHSSWVLNSIRVSTKYYEEIREFARLYDFKISDKAEKQLELAEEKAKSVSRVTPAAVVNNTDNPDGLKKILNSSKDVLEDLKDE